jgi:DNA-binding beta-propeller fold protein YncE
MSKSLNNNTVFFLIAVLVVGIIAISYSPFIDTEAFGDKRDNNKHKDYGHDTYKFKDPSVIVKKITCNNFNVNINGLRMDLSLDDLVSNLVAQAQDANNNNEISVNSLGNEERNSLYENNNDYDGFIYICIDNINAQGSSAPTTPAPPSTPSDETPSSNFKTATKYEFIKQWGSKGTGDGEFQRVHDLDFDPTEKYLYTIDRDGNRVQVFDKDGNFINKWGSKGTGNGQFIVPYSVDVDSKGDVWVADRGNNRVQKFDKDGNFLFKFGTFGSKEGQFNNPRQVAVDKDVKFLYVVDSKNNRIQKFDPNGNFIKSWGTLGSDDGQFSLPVTVIIDSKGDIIVNDRGTNRVQKFDPDGNFLLKFGSTGTGNSQFSEVEHMATDKYDNIYVNDPQLGDTGSGQPSVKKFDTNGNFITKFGSLEEDDGQFTDPEHLAIDSDGNVYVSDKSSNIIQVFKPVG